MDCQLNYARTQLDKLQKTNVFNATFHIWHNGHFGTINTFRLGRLPSAPVDWSEINAAWGQTVLLLASLARKLDLTFSRYKLVPYGNHSYIEVIKKQLVLYNLRRTSLNIELIFRCWLIKENYLYTEQVDSAFYGTRSLIKLWWPFWIA